jgi:hypothetical protein
MVTERRPCYWLNVFTEETWLEAAHHGFTVTGFQESRWNSVRLINPGDFLVCYLKGRSAYVGLLRVTGPAFRDTSKIWESQVFASRLPVEPEIILLPDRGLSVPSLADQLSYFKGSRGKEGWSVYFQGSPRKIGEDDGRVIEAALQQVVRDKSRLLDLQNIPGPVRAPKRAPVRPDPPHLEPSPSPPLTPDIPSAGLGVMRSVEPKEELIAAQLLRTASAGDESAAFELALVEAFAFLGFEAERKSGAGDTDVLVVAQLGADSYRAVVDAKSSRQGRVSNAQVDWFALERHRERHEADHILVVAPAFSGGELARDAERTGAALLTAGDLGEVLRLHVRAPFSLPALRDLFRYPGKPDLPIARMRELADDTFRLQHLLPDIVDTISELYQYRIYDPIGVDALIYPLARRRRGQTYSREEVAAALELLCVPQLAVLRRIGESRYTLQMPKETLARRVRALTTVFETNSENEDRVRSIADKQIAPH